MPMWTCDFDACEKPAVRTLGDCILCGCHLCASHLESDFHGCPKWEDEDLYDPAAGRAEERELQKLINKINISALTARASELHHGVKCSVSPLRYDRKTRNSVMGGMNYHVEINFEDGSVWLARIRRYNATSPPPALRDYIIQSEVATLKFLERTGVPAPMVFDFALESDRLGNPVGVGYILMEKLPGKSLIWSDDNITVEQGRKVMSQLADIFTELRKYPFDLLGSLDDPSSGDGHVGAFARESLTDFSQSEMKALGPFSTLKDYHTASITLILDLIVRQEMYSQQSVNAYLIHRFLLDIVPSVLPPSSSSSSSSSTDRGDDSRNHSSSSKNSKQFFYLKHADDKGDHILVDDDFNITGIIDWEWAHTAPPAHAFNSPIGLLPAGDFFDGVNELGADEVVFAKLLEEKGRQHSDIAKNVRTGRLQHRFIFCCGYDLTDWNGFLGLFRGLRDAIGVDGGLDWDAWKRTALQRYENDPGLILLLTEARKRR